MSLLAAASQNPTTIGDGIMVAAFFAFLSVLVWMIFRD